MAIPRSHLLHLDGSSIPNLSRMLLLMNFVRKLVLHQSKVKLWKQQSTLPKLLSIISGRRKASTKGPLICISSNVQRIFLFVQKIDPIQFQVLKKPFNQLGGSQKNEHVKELKEAASGDFNLLMATATSVTKQFNMNYLFVFKKMKGNSELAVNLKRYIEKDYSKYIPSPSVKIRVVYVYESIVPNAPPKKTSVKLGWTERNNRVNKSKETAEGSPFQN